LDVHVSLKFGIDRYFLEDDDIDNLDVKEDEVNAKAELM